MLNLTKHVDAAFIYLVNEYSRYGAHWRTFRYVLICQYFKFHFECINLLHVQESDAETRLLECNDFELLYLFTFFGQEN